MSNNKKSGFIMPLLIFEIMFSFQVSSQDNSPYYLSTIYDSYIAYLLNSGKMDITHPLNQPYTAEQLYNVLENEESNKTSYWNANRF